jgi:hypothetical protein
MIYLYESFTPNVNIHYCYTSKSTYLTKIATHLKLTINEDNYRINNDILVIQRTTANITYVALNLNNDIRFYHVIGTKHQSGNTYLTLSLDIWATYYGLAKITNLKVGKCNRNIGNGIIQDDSLCKSDKFQVGYFYDDSFLITDVMLVCSIAFNATESIFGTTTAPIVLLCFNLGALESTVRSSIGTRSIFEYACEVAQNIFKITSNQNSAIGGTAQIINAYLVPRNCISIDTTQSFKVETHATYTAFLNMYKVRANTFRYLVRADRNGIDYNNKFYLGSNILGGLELTKTTETDVIISWNFICKSDEMQVIISQGNNSEDITDQFTLSLANNNANLNSSQKIERAITTGVKLISGGLAMTNPATFMGGVGTFASIVTDYIPKNVNPRLIKAGNAISLFEKTFNVPHNPFCYIYQPSINSDETSKALINGAVFNVIINNFASIFESNYIFSTEETIPTYIQALAEVSEVPMDAIDYFKGTLLAGGRFYGPNDY